MYEQNQPEERKSLRLLIVDDNASARSGMKALLETVASHKWKPDIFEAASGPEAIDLVETLQPDLILMDAHMPTFNGIEATRIIKQRWPTIKVIILTLYDAYRDIALAAGADLFLLKGGSSEELFSAIYNVSIGQDKS
ncbi:MAG TPA: response regulator transcription factor [Anaerolineales bacterium]|nr:response regulator transcription factor [Anaerolineales bacterium]